MTKRGRPSAHIPSAYDYRRSIFLCQILARIDADNWHEELLSLAEHWQIAHDGTMTDCMKQLAQHTLEHGKKNWKG